MPGICPILFFICRIRILPPPPALTGKMVYVIVRNVDKRRLKYLTIAGSMTADAIAVMAADLTGFLVRFGGAIPEKHLDFFLGTGLIIGSMRLLGFYIFHFYDGSLNKTGFDNFVNSVKACTLSTVMSITILYFLDIGSDPRGVAVLVWCISILYVNAWRVAAKRLLAPLVGQDIFYSHLLIIGTSPGAAEIAMKAQMDASVNYRLVGFVDPESGTGAHVAKERIIGTMDELPVLVKKYDIDEVIIVDENIGKKKISELMSLLSWEGISLKAAPPTYEEIINNMVLYESGVAFLGPTFSIKPAPAWYWGLKSVSDKALSSVLLVVTLPVIVMAALLIRLSSPGPVLYLQKRTGLNGKPFILYKFRTMRLGAEKGNRPRWAKADDARITSVGKFLRRFRIDELPQLINVLSGEMSLIGPRPERPFFTSKLMRTIPFYAQRLQAKPGLTGWAQVNYRYTDTEKGAREKLLYDLFYLQNASLALDLLIALKTIKVVLTGYGAH